MSFTAPEHLLWTVFAVIGFVALYRWLELRTKKMGLAYTNIAFMESVVGSNRFWERILRILFGVGIACIGIASAGPHVTLRLPLSSGSVVVCVDTSGSMSSTDVLPSRAQAALTAVHHFTTVLGPSVRIGIVSFSANAQVNIQPTADRSLLSDAIDTIPRPNGPTAIGDALNLAGSILPASGHRAIILLTDGVNNRGSDPLEIAHDLASHHIVLYTIGIGTPRTVASAIGGEDQTSTDPDALKQYAEITGGTSVMAADADSIVNAFSSLATNTIWETQRVDASLICAVIGGLCITSTLLLGLGLGKFPG